MSSVSSLPTSPDATLGVTVNGRPARLVPGATLLVSLRNDLALNGPKYGCGFGECGACLVLVDGRAARSCCVPAAGVRGRCVDTLEGLVDPASTVSDAVSLAVHRAFIACEAAQCGYCLNGMMVATIALLRREPAPSEAQVRAALSHNLCRCGTHLEILQAVRHAAALLAP